MMSLTVSAGGSSAVPLVVVKCLLTLPIGEAAVGGGIVPRRLQEASNPVSYRNLEYCDVEIGFALNVLYDIGFALCSCLKLLMWMVTEPLARLVREPSLH